MSTTTTPSAPTVSAVPWRPRLRGALQILRFNWPAYVAGAVVLGLSAAVLYGLPLPAAVWWAGLVAATCAGYWLVASLVVSYWVYDHRGVTRVGWLPPLLPIPPVRWANVHAGFDESTPHLRRLLGGHGVVLDLYDPTLMTEPSITRARRASPPPGAPLPARHDRLPLRDASIDAAFLLLAAHELRMPGHRLALFRELHRAVAPGGTVLVAEHLRDAWNILAYGPGAFHFHSRRQWLRAAHGAAFEVAREIRVTPFVRVFVLGRKP